MATPQRLPIVDSDDGLWGDIIRQYLSKEHFNDDTDNPANGGHQNVTMRPGTTADAPLTFSAGTSLTTPMAGAMEFDGNYFFLTQGTVRKTIALYDDKLGAGGDTYYRTGAGALNRVPIGGNNTIMSVSGGVPTWTSAINGATLTAPTLSAGTATTAPITMTPGTNMTTPTAGALEFDGTAFYATAAASTRQVVQAQQLITLTSPYTLTSSTSPQKLFNASANGAVTLAVGTYFFDCFVTLSAMSTTNGSFGWTLGAGTATIASILWHSEAVKGAIATPATPQTTANTTANTTLVTATTSATGWVRIRGKVRISAAGTVIPQINLGVAAPAVVAADSYFRIWSVGANNVTSVGRWS